MNVYFSTKPRAKWRPFAETLRIEQPFPNVNVLQANFLASRTNTLLVCADSRLMQLLVGWGPNLNLGRIYRLNDAARRVLHIFLLSVESLEYMYLENRKVG